jgi:hypothetical protein
MKLLFENWREYVIKEEGAFIEGSGLHWSRYELEYDDITLEPRDTRQGKGKYGFYITRGSDIETCEKALRSYGGAQHYLYRIDYRVKEKNIEKISFFKATRINQELYNQYLSDGKQILDPGPRGVPTPEIIILDKSVITSFKLLGQGGETCK